MKDHHSCPSGLGAALAAWFARVLLTIAVLVAFAAPVAAQHLPTAGQRKAAAVTSWITALTPVVLDAQVSWKAPERTRALTLQATRLAVLELGVFGLKHLTHRRRPCVELPEGCGADHPYYDVPSGHTAFPFSALGGPRLAVVVPFGIGTAGLRVAAGKHDWLGVISGAAVGALTSRIR